VHIRPVASASLRAVIALAVVASVAAFMPVTGSHGVAQAAGVGDCNADAAWPANNQSFADQVVALVNQHRAAMGLVQLKVSPTLTAAAVWKARHMAQYSYMQHDDPAPPIARLWYQRVQACGYTGGGMGENIAYGYRTPQDVMTGWLNSPGHKANIENASYRAIGVGAAGSTVFWAQDFGTVDDSGGGSPPPPPPPPPPPSDTSAPGMPGLLTATASSTSQVNLTWGAASDNVGVTGYRVYRGGVQVGTSNGTTYTDTGLAAGTAYSYTVRAYDAAGNLGPSSNTATVTTQSAPPTGDTTPPGVPGTLGGTAVSTSQVNLTWGAASDNVGVTGYRVYRGGVQVGTASGTTYSDTGLAGGTAYSYTVRAYDAAGNLGPSSNSVTVTTQSGSSGGGGGTTGGTAYVTSVTLQSGTVTSGTAANLRAQDGSTFNVTAPGPSWWGNFTLPASPATLSVTYAGSATAGCTQVVSLWDWTTSTWQLLDSRAASSLTQSVTVAATGSLSRFVDAATGAARVRVGCTRADGTSFAIRADRLTVAT
jgi:uncharacterized protein YkwD/chitodextrinase